MSKTKKTPQECEQCNYRWESTKQEPKACPKCKRYDWNNKPNYKAI